MEKTAIGLLSRVTAGLASAFGGVSNTVSTCCKVAIETLTSASDTFSTFNGYYINNSVYRHTIKHSIVGTQDSVYAARKEDNSRTQSDGDSVTSLDEPSTQRELVTANDFRSLYIASQNLTLTGIDSAIYARDSNTKDAHHVTQIFEQVEKIEKESGKLLRQQKLFSTFIKIVNEMIKKYGADENVQKIFLKGELIKPKKRDPEEGGPIDDEDDEYEQFYNSRGNKINLVGDYGKEIVELARYVSKCKSSRMMLQSLFYKISEEKNDIEQKIDELMNYREALYDSGAALYRHYYIPCVSFRYDGYSHNTFTNIVNSIVCKLRGKSINTPVYYHDGQYRNACYMSLVVEKNNDFTYDDAKCDIENIPLGQSNGLFSHVSGLDLITFIKYIRENIQNIGSLDELPRLFGRFRSNITDYLGLFSWVIGHMRIINVLPTCELDFQ